MPRRRLDGRFGRRITFPLKSLLHCPHPSVGFTLNSIEIIVFIWARPSSFHLGATLLFPDPFRPAGSLETEMPLFTHDIGDLRDRMFFQSVKLRSSNSGVRVKVFIRMCPWYFTAFLTFRSSLCMLRTRRLRHQTPISWEISTPPVA